VEAEPLVEQAALVLPVMAAVVRGRPAPELVQEKEFLQVLRDQQLSMAAAEMVITLLVPLELQDLVLEVTA
jgi:hypothetical protein